MGTNAKGERNKLHNQTTRQTLHAECKIKAPHNQANYKDRHLGDNTQQPHQ